jgi:hypothetical protein
MSIKMRLGRRVLAALVTFAAFQVATLTAHSADAPPLLAWGPSGWGGDDYNPTIPDAVGAIDALRTHKDALGFNMNGANDPTRTNHWEGVQRLMSGEGRYLVLSRALGSESEDVAFVVVEMASRNNQGLRFRSNRLSPDPICATVPPDEDRIVFSAHHEAGFAHAGGMQSLGNILAVPFERSGVGSKVVFYDVSKPLNPVRLGNVVDHSSLAGEAGTATLGKLADGRFLLVIGRSDANILDFYVSTGLDIRATSYELFYTWHASELHGGDGEFGDYQTLNIVAQDDGSIFMVGMHKSLAGFVGRDFVDLFLIENGSGNSVSITKVNAKHLFCDDGCDLDAAGGAYIDPAGRLYLYATTHDNDGPFAGNECFADCAGADCSVELAEFRPVPHADCGEIEDAWVELYSDHDFGGRSVIVDFPDRDLEDYSNFKHVEGFGDEASSARYCVPLHATAQLWQHDGCDGDVLELVGDGKFHNIPDLSSFSFGDKTSCFQWRGGPFARAGADRTVECTGSPTSVPLDGSASILLEGTALEYFWAGPGVTFSDPHGAQPIGSFPLGTSPITLTVSNSVGVDSDDVTITVGDSTAPTITCPSNLIVDATMPAGAVVNYPAPVASDGCGIASLVCAPVSASTFSVGITLVQCTASDLAGHRASCSFTVKVKSPAEQTADLIVKVNGLNNVTDATKNSLLVKLQAAQDHMVAGRQRGACGKLLDFINEVNAQRNKKQLTDAQAADLIADATRIMAALGCS